MICSRFVRCGNRQKSRERQRFDHPHHRFVLKEKAKQAKLLLAVIELMEAGVPLETPKFVPVHRNAMQVDERVCDNGSGAPVGAARGIAANTG
ncbi:hypothetical protein [Paenibacillus gorillae]|uniref:hypothetical protein n=1 Tax=Paenibacillus gorillae TaxID=1243662 RepID=UPI0006950ACA|nr:hypothetical protein [Paenibacillus gorillae]